MLSRFHTVLTTANHTSYASYTEDTKSHTQTKNDSTRTYKMASKYFIKIFKPRPSTRVITNMIVLVEDASFRYESTREVRLRELLFCK
jgi:hypothetical protein